MYMHIDGPLPGETGSSYKLAQWAGDVRHRRCEYK